LLRAFHHDSMPFVRKAAAQALERFLNTPRWVPPLADRPRAQRHAQEE
jgi:hypothetical protein